RPSLYFVSSRRRHTRFSRDWSSDVCSSDLLAFAQYAAIKNYIALNFFLIFSRAWELFLGSAIALIPAHKFRIGRWREELLSIARSEERRVGRGWSSPGESRHAGHGMWTIAG